MQQPSRAWWVDNLLWFVGSLGLAFFVWVNAVAQTDPVEQWRLVERVPIRIEAPPGLTVINRETLTSSASVQMRAQRSVRQLLVTDDVLVEADLSNLGSGTHTVPLRATVADERRATVVDISPRQLTITLEVEQTQYVPVRADIISEPSSVFLMSEPQFDVLQVTVNGPQSRVAQVVAASVALDLSEARGAFEDDVRLLPVDTEGAVVAGVSIDPPIVRARVDIQQRQDVREVRVQPNILALPDGYILSSFEYEPQVVYVSGPAEALAALPATLRTEPIDLAGRTGSFEVSAQVELPDPSLVLVTGQTITLSFVLETQTVTRQFDGVPIEVFGLPVGLRAEIAPTEVTVLLTGPQPVLERLTAEDVRVFLDASSLEVERSYQLVPSAVIDEVDEDAATTNISVLPAQVDVRVVPAEGTPEATQESN